MRGLEKNRMKRDKQTHRHTDGHRDSMIESAQWADSMKIVTFNAIKGVRTPDHANLPAQVLVFPALSLQTAGG